MGSFLFQISSMLYIVLIIIIYFGKKRLNTLENRIYISLVIVSFITLILDVTSVYFGLIKPTESFSNFLCKLYLVGIVCWVIDFTYYIYVISSRKNDGRINDIKVREYFRKVFYCALIMFLLSTLIIFILPLNIYSDGNIMYTYGPSATISYAISGICLVIWISCIIFNSKQIKNKKYYPVYAFVVFAGTGIMIQKLFPEILLVSSAASFITVLTYFTIENPDMKMIEQLNIAKDQADKANNAKTDFLSSMSHEIRTPLNAIVGFSECIKQSQTLEEAKDNADDIINASGTLLELVNGILDISKIEAGKIEIHNSSYDSKQLFDSIIKLGKGRLGEKPLDFRIHIADDIPETLYGDHANVKKVIINILTNAIKYTEKGYIDFSVKCVKTNDICRLIISVEDSGRGIKEEDIDKLFTKFQRLDEDRNTTIEGTGLGLAITKQLVDLMGGKIVVNSTFGEGSKFTVAIDQKISETKVEKQEVREFNDLDLNGKCILIVDDNKLNLKVASKILEKYHPNIDTVESGIDCIERINNGNKYDLILMDDMMPRMSGGETLLRLRQIENFNTKVVVLTANAISGMEEKYKNDGFDDYLSKPINRDKLHEVLVKFIGNKKEEIKVEKINLELEQPQQTIIEDITTFDLTNKKILIVDDNRLNLKVANTFLKKYNPTIEEALSGIDCINKIKEGNKYDLIFMDDMMPEMSGVETFHELEKIEKFNIPVVALTANAIDGMREQYLKEGFDEYLSKPINKAELDRILKLLFLNNNKTEKIEIEKKEEKQIDDIIKRAENSSKPKFDELPEYLFEISDSNLATTEESKSDTKQEKKEEVYKEKIDTSKQFSSVYITKDETINNIEYLKENNIDVDNGIELLGDIITYNETMEEFYNNIKERVTKLRTFKESNDLANYAIEAHALKSDSKYLGFTALAQKSLDHEMRSKANDIEFINTDFDKLLNAINRVINVIKKYLGR